MLTEKEKQFIIEWEAERGRLSNFSGKLVSGLPMAMLFSLPIILLIFVIYLFFPEWYTKISNTSAGTFITVLVAVFICILFFSYFRMQFRWEMKEQLYREILARSKKGDAPVE